MKETVNNFALGKRTDIYNNHIDGQNCDFSFIKRKLFKIKGKKQSSMMFYLIH